MHKAITTCLLFLLTLLSPSIAMAQYFSNTCQGRWSFSIHGGIAPNVYVDRDTANASSATPPAFQLIKIPAFHNQFKTPFFLQGELGYMVGNDWEVFYDFDWSHSKGKSHAFTHKNTAGPIDAQGQQKFSDFNGYGNYLGTRYYVSFESVPLKPFAGLKIGVMSRSAVKAKQTTTSFGRIFNDNFTYFKQDTTISGGLQLGADWQLTQNLSLMFKGEVIATNERKSRIIFNHPPRPVIKAGNAAIQLSIPITVGVKWTL